MSLKKVARIFADQHRIKLDQRRNILVGRRERLVIGYWDNGLREQVFVSKSFPPLERVYESKIVIADEGQKADLKMEVLYGCLEDYITPLDKAEGNLCRAVHRVLYDSYLVDIINPQPPETVLYEQLPMDISDYDSYLWELLGSFYPTR